MAIFCEKCGDSGFAGNGTGYGDVCDECGGQSAAALDDPKLLREKCDSLHAELDAALRTGKAEGLREAAEILRTAAAADARSAVYSTAPNHRERFQKLSENELVMAQQMLTRAEEVERE